MFILSLPDELLSRAFHYFDCWGILAARLTCWRLYAISKSQLLWQYKALETSYSSGVPLLEEPVENYTLKELEERIIARARASQKWHKVDPECFQWQNIATDYRDQILWDLKLLPGGRWLLVSLKGCVSIMDLDAPNSTEEPLFNVADSVNDLLKSTIWIDPTKCWLSPRMALYHWNAAIHQDLSKIWIYQLNSTGRGPNMKWSAEKMAIIQTSPIDGAKSGLQLEKEYVLETCIHYSRYGSFWKAYLYQYSGCRIRSCNWVTEASSTTLLLPESRISTITDTHIRVSVIEPVGLDGLALQATFCILRDRVPPWQQSFKLHSTLHYSYFNIAGGGSILEIQFPRDANEVYLNRLPFACGRNSSATEGPCLLVLQLEPDFINIIDCISYKLEEGATRQVASQIIIRANLFLDRPKFVDCDVASGRLLYRLENGEHILLQV